MTCHAEVDDRWRRTDLLSRKPDNLLIHQIQIGDQLGWLGIHVRSRRIVSVGVKREAEPVSIVLPLCLVPVRKLRQLPIVASCIVDIENKLRPYLLCRLRSASR